MRSVFPLLVSLFLVVLLLGTGSCRKTGGIIPETGCILRYQPDIKARKLPVRQYDSAKQFLEANGLSLDTLQPIGFYYSGPDINGHPFYQVPARKFINGLPVYNARLLYDFTSGILGYSESVGYDYPLATSDTTAHLTPEQVRSIFLSSDPDSYAYPIRGLVAVPHHPTHWADSCIYATLQYGEKNMFDSCCGTLRYHLLIRTWTIQQTAESNPLAFVNDESGDIRPLIIYTVN